MTNLIKIFFLTAVLVLMFSPVRGKSRLGGTAAHAFQAGRTSNGISFVKGDELNQSTQNSLSARPSSQAIESSGLNPGLPLNLNPLDAVNSAGIKSMGAGDVLKGFKFNLPLDLNKINMDTNVPMSPRVNTSQDPTMTINLKQFLTPRDISSDDLLGATKAIVVLIIEIFLTVISITSQILKLILEFLR